MARVYQDATLYIQLRERPIEAGARLHPLLTHLRIRIVELAEYASLADPDRRVAKPRALARIALRLTHQRHCPPDIRRS